MVDRGTAEFAQQATLETQYSEIGPQCIFPDGILAYSRKQGPFSPMQMNKLIADGDKNNQHRVRIKLDDFLLYNNNHNSYATATREQGIVNGLMSPNSKNAFQTLETEVVEANPDVDLIMTPIDRSYKQQENVESYSSTLLNQNEQQMGRGMKRKKIFNSRSSLVGYNSHITKEQQMYVQNESNHTMEMVTQPLDDDNDSNCFDFMGNSRKKYGVQQQKQQQPQYYQQRTPIASLGGTQLTTCFGSPAATRVPSHNQIMSRQEFSPAASIGSPEISHRKGEAVQVPNFDFHIKYANAKEYQISANSPQKSRNRIFDKPQPAILANYSNNQILIQEQFKAILSAVNDIKLVEVLSIQKNRYEQKIISALPVLHKLVNSFKNLKNRVTCHAQDLGDFQKYAFSDIQRVFHESIGKKTEIQTSEERTQRALNRIVVMKKSAAFTLDQVQKQLELCEPSTKLALVEEEGRKQSWLESKCVNLMEVLQGVLQKIPLCFEQQKLNQIQSSRTVSEIRFLIGQRLFNNVINWIKKHGGSKPHQGCVNLGECIEVFVVCDAHLDQLSLLLPEIVARYKTQLEVWREQMDGVINEIRVYTSVLKNNISNGFTECKMFREQIDKFIEERKEAEVLLYSVQLPYQERQKENNKVIENTVNAVKLCHSHFEEIVGQLKQKLSGLKEFQVKEGAEVSLKSMPYECEINEMITVSQLQMESLNRFWRMIASFTSVATSTKVNDEVEAISQKWEKTTHDLRQESNASTTTRDQLDSMIQEANEDVIRLLELKEPMRSLYIGNFSDKLWGVLAEQQEAIDNALDNAYEAIDVMDRLIEKLVYELRWQDSDVNGSIVKSTKELVDAMQMFLDSSRKEFPVMRGVYGKKNAVEVNSRFDEQKYRDQLLLVRLFQKDVADTITHLKAISSEWKEDYNRRIECCRAEKLIVQVYGEFFRAVQCMFGRQLTQESLLNEIISQMNVVDTIEIVILNKLKITDGNRADNLESRIAMLKELLFEWKKQQTEAKEIAIEVECSGSVEMVEQVLGLLEGNAQWLSKELFDVRVKRADVSEITFAMNTFEAKVKEIVKTSEKTVTDIEKKVVLDLITSYKQRNIKQYEDGVAQSSLDKDYSNMLHLQRDFTMQFTSLLGLVEQVVLNGVDGRDSKKQKIDKLEDLISGFSNIEKVADLQSVQENIRSRERLIQNLARRSSEMIKNIQGSSVVQREMDYLMNRLEKDTSEVQQCELMVASVLKVASEYLPDMQSALKVGQPIPQVKQKLQTLLRKVERRIDELEDPNDVQEQEILFLQIGEDDEITKMKQLQKKEVIRRKETKCIEVNARVVSVLSRIQNVIQVIEECLIRLEGAEVTLDSGFGGLVVGNDGDNADVDRKQSPINIFDEKRRKRLVDAFDLVQVIEGDYVEIMNVKEELCVSERWIVDTVKSAFMGYIQKSKRVEFMELINVIRSVKEPGDLNQLIDLMSQNMARSVKTIQNSLSYAEDLVNEMFDVSKKVVSSLNVNGSAPAAVAGRISQFAQEKVLQFWKSFFIETRYFFETYTDIKSKKIKVEAETVVGILQTKVNALVKMKQDAIPVGFAEFFEKLKQGIIKDYLL